MVPGTPRQKIISGFIFICLILVLIFYFGLFQKTQNIIVYGATNNQIDLSVVSGIAMADREESAIKSGAVRAVIIPHHLIDAKSVALGIKDLSLSSPQKIIIISPDHFAKCPKLMCTTKGIFQTFFGDVIINNESVEYLEKFSDIVVDSNLFSEEHGIYGIVPFIKHYVPKAEIIPIVISQKGMGDQITRSRMISVLNNILSDKNVSLVISSDFSHYLPLAAAEQEDILTQNSFCSGNSQEILNLKNPAQSDCPLCLWLLEQEAKKLDFWYPNLINHNNSADLLKDYSTKETTSHFTFSFSDSATSTNCLIIK
ncbi:MAG: AmmeMemoRadiSam system protein B [bacterium]